jgi:hypothetical protein
LPSEEEVAAFIHGEEVPDIGNLLAGLTLQKFDALVMQVRKEELLPQHWQVITAVLKDTGEFEQLAEVGRLRVGYKDQELSRARIANLKLGWIELAGKRPSLWNVSDLFAALRRLIEKKVAVDWGHLLHAIRDVWASLTLPHGREQLMVLWNCLVVIRQKKK